VMHHATHSAFASPTALCVVKMSFQQESYKRKAFWLGGERRRKNSIPLSSMHLTDKQRLQRGSVKISSCARETDPLRSNKAIRGALQAAGDKIFHGETFGGTSDY